MCGAPCFQGVHCLLRTRARPLMMDNEASHESCSRNLKHGAHKASKLDRLASEEKRVLCPKSKERILKCTKEHTDDMPVPQAVKVRFVVLEITPQELFMKSTREHADDLPVSQVMESCTHCSSQATSATLVGDAVLSAELTRARSTSRAGSRAVHCSCPLMLCVSPQYGVRVNQPLRHPTEDNMFICTPCSRGMYEPRFFDR